MAIADQTLRIPQGTLQIVSSSEVLAETLADYIVAAAKQAIAAHGRFLLVLAGGSTPKAAYSLLAQAPRVTQIAWEHVKIFFGDERCVPPSSVESNFRMANEALLSKIRIHETQLFRIRGEDLPRIASAAYDDLLRRHLTDKPVFDLVLLGMGPDAHTASWFPDVKFNETRLATDVMIEKLGTHRITMTPRAISGARSIIVTTAGPEKADALSEVLGKTNDPLHWPAQRLIPSADRLRWLVDREAAAKLPVAVSTAS